MSRDKQPWILGISASHNGSACLLRGDEIVVAIQEERLSRFKRHRIYGAGPSLAIDYCLNYAGIEPSALNLVVLCVQGESKSDLHDVRRDPSLNVVTHQIPTMTIPHHYGHALSAFATSGFEEAAILVVDGTGSPATDFTAIERKLINGSFADAWETISLFSGCGTTIVPLEKHVAERGAWLSMCNGGMPCFGSLGGMFSAVAQQVFGEPMDAGKVMGLAPYGEPHIPCSDFFEISNGRFCFKDTVPLHFRHDERWPARAREYEMLACSVQAALEIALIYLVGHLHELSPSENLCYAGGVALNSVANERIIRESSFRNVYIVPAAEDSGTAIGAAYYGLWQLNGYNSRRRMIDDAFGRTYASSAVSSILNETANIEAVSSTNVIADTVDLLCDGKIVGWFDGGSELGPRALGHRSILCDPRRPDAKETLNLRVKRRESFRPFAPAVLLEQAESWFEFGNSSPESPFMLRVCDVKPDRRSEVPAIVHVDGTGRLQTVDRDSNPRFYDLIRCFYERTGVPMLVNTSFNVMGEPIVETPADALACLIKSDLDCCVFEEGIVFKESTNPLVKGT
jgi:carbamoyltransferase